MSNDTIPSTASTDTVERYNLAKAEHAAVTAWQKDGKQGDAPATPNLDAINAEKQSGAKRMTTKKTSTRPEPGSIRFWHQGKPLADIDNYVSRLAYDDTRGMGEGGRTLTSAELTDLLAEAGITAPNTSTWEFELPNGRWIGAVLKGDTVPENLAVVRGRTVKAKAAKTGAPVWSIERTDARKYSALRDGVELGRPVRSASAAQAQITEAGGPADVSVSDVRTEKVA